MDKNKIVTVRKEKLLFPCSQVRHHSGLERLENTRGRRSASALSEYDAVEAVDRSGRTTQQDFPPRFVFCRHQTASVKRLAKKDRVVGALVCCQWSV